MKAERRHELQQNSLARFIDNLPVMAALLCDRNPAGNCAAAAGGRAESDGE